MAFSHPNARSVWSTIEADEDGASTVIVIETDLELNDEAPAYDRAKVEALIDAASAYASDTNGKIDGIRIVPIGKANS